MLDQIEKVKRKKFKRLSPSAILNDRLLSIIQFQVVTSSLLIELSINMFPLSRRKMRPVELLLTSMVTLAFSWIPRANVHFREKQKAHFSTPFELDYYDDSSNPYSDEMSSLGVPEDTKLVLGLNKYSHDTALCAADSISGKVLFAMSKERLSRKKHDGGNVATLVETCLDTLDLDYDAIQKVVMNNHHHRVMPLEDSVEHMEWECGLGINGGVEGGYDEPENLLLDADRVRPVQMSSCSHVKFFLISLFKPPTARAITPSCPCLLDSGSKSV